MAGRRETERRYRLVEAGRWCDDGGPDVERFRLRVSGYRFRRGATFARYPQLPEAKRPAQLENLLRYELRLMHVRADAAYARLDGRTTCDT